MCFSGSNKEIMESLSMVGNIDNFGIQVRDDVGLKHSTHHLIFRYIAN